MIIRGAVTHKLQILYAVILGREGSDQQVNRQRGTVSAQRTVTSINIPFTQTIYSAISRLSVCDPTEVYVIVVYWGHRLIW